MNWYEEQIERRRQQLESGADRARQEAESHFRAAAFGRGGISSLDPDATVNFGERLRKDERWREVVKEANAIIQGKPMNERTDEKINALVALGIPAKSAEKCFHPNFHGYVGFPGCAILENGAEMRRIKARVDDIERRRVVTARPVRRIGDVEVRDNTDWRKVELRFPGKPAPDVHAFLKANCFRWMRSAGCWWRPMSNRTEWLLSQLAERLGHPLESAADGPSPE